MERNIRKRKSNHRIYLKSAVYIIVFTYPLLPTDSRVRKARSYKKKKRDEDIAVVSLHLCHVSLKCLRMYVHVDVQLGLYVCAYYGDIKRCFSGWDKRLEGDLCCGYNIALARPSHGR